MIERVAVIGGGAWGTALANAAAIAGRSVVLWARDPEVAARIGASGRNPRLPGVSLHERVSATADPAGLEDAEAALLAVPAQSVRSALRQLGGALRPDCALVICAKGIERATGAFMSEVVEWEQPRRPAAVLSGPSFAADVARGLPTAVTLASRDGDLAAALAAAFSGPTFRVYHGTDVRGVEIGGAAKNVLAIAAGIVEGRGLGESAKAALVARGFAELLRFAAAYGARPETLMGLSGLGDLVLTCGSPQSRNFALGLRIGRGEAPAGESREPLAEGAFTAGALVRLAASAGIAVPISEATEAVLDGRLGIDEAVRALMARPLGPEAR